MFTLTEFLAGGFIASVAVSFMVFLKERKARREEVEQVTEEWSELHQKTTEEWQKAYGSLSKDHTAEKEKAQHYREGLRQISKRRYLQIGQDKAPHATFLPPWEVADDYLKEPVK